MSTNAEIAKLEEQLLQKRAEEAEKRKDRLDYVLYTLTETGNAERFTELVGDTFKFIRELNQWVFWDNEKWNIDRTGEATRKYKEIIEQLNNTRNEFAKELKNADDDEKKEISKKVAAIEQWIKRSQNRATITNTLALAQAEHGVTVPYNDYDYKGHFLGVANGIVDLRTAELRSGDPSFHMLKSSNVSFNPDAQCPNWLKFLDDIMEGDQDKIEFLQQVAGSSLVGSTKESMFIFHGDGSNGKSKFVEMLGRVLGKVDDDGYKVSINPEVFAGKVNNPEYYLAQIKGARCIVMSETGTSGVLNDTLVKQVVDSEEGISARPIRGEPFEFAVVGTVMMLTNHLPKVTVTDNGTWRRLVLVKFNRKFTENEKDRNLVEEKLLPELEGIMSWCVEGARRYFAQGQKFVLPRIIKDDTQQWRSEEDKLDSFVRTNLVNDGGATKLTDFVEAYTEWCKKRNQYAGSEKEIKKHLEAKGYIFDTGGTGGTARILNWSLGSVGNEEIDRQMDKIRLLRSVGNGIDFTDK